MAVLVRAQVAAQVEAVLGSMVDSRLSPVVEATVAARVVTDSDRRTRRRRTLAQGSQTVTDAHGVRATLAQGDMRHSYTN